MGRTMTRTSEHDGPRVASFERHELPAIPGPDRALLGSPPHGPLVGIAQFDTYAVIRCGDVCAEIVRFAYWHPNDGVETVEVSFDARMHVPDEGAGIANIQLDDPRQLFDVADVARRAGFLLDEARRRHATTAVEASVVDSEGSER
ncbi:MAG: hypothetical protein QOF15_4593 [Mycobacterium sp.]|nr:hypothetical protein [Mycobacterium sp.]